MTSPIFADRRREPADRRFGREDSEGLRGFDFRRETQVRAERDAGSSYQMLVFDAFYPPHKNWKKPQNHDFLHLPVAGS